ncbi:MAG: cysteine desulfurase family protein [Parcubacteria group bacterium]|jgi:cysteine desulfurase
MKKIYLDYAATTPVDKDVLKEMLPYFSEKFGNASSIHSFGQTAQQAIDQARAQAAKFFGATPNEIIFTSGATESNNLAIKGVVKSYYTKFKTKPHIVTSAFEHHCVLDTCKALEKENLAEITFVSPDKDGVIQVADIQKAIKKNTILISIMYVNNEIGTVQPIAEIGKMVKMINNGERKETDFQLQFHTDATQAVNYFDCNVNKLGVHLLSMSAHKIYGPKGNGILYIKKGTPIKKIQDGGDQEYKLRAGTQNVPGIVGLGKALELVMLNAKRENVKIKNLRDYFIKKVLQEIPKTKLNGSKVKRSPNNTNFSFEDVEGEGLLLSLDMEGIACSTGSACSSGALSPSHVLLAIGLKPEQAHGSLRMTLGKHTTKQELDITLKKLKVIVERLRQISGNVLSDYYSSK